MKVTYLWTAPSGYLSACIAELVRRRRYDVTLLSFPETDDAPFAQSALTGQRVFTAGERGSYRALQHAVASTSPDIIVISGWSQAKYARLVHDSAFDKVRFVLGADTPIRFDWRQFVARMKIGKLLEKCDAVCVPGDRGYQVMRYWKVPERKIHRVLYGIDYALFAGTNEATQVSGRYMTRRFVFAGRYVTAKGITVLLEGYRRYRASVSSPWGLSCFGNGPLKSSLSGEPGVLDHGFQQPEALAKRFRQASVFVLPSTYEPWGQALVEAAAAGLPIICTHACGAAPEVVRQCHNGLVIPTNDPAALADALRWMHDHQPRLADMGAAGQQLARPFGADRWAENQEMIFDRLISTRRRERC